MDVDVVNKFARARLPGPELEAVAKYAAKAAWPAGFTVYQRATPADGLFVGQRHREPGVPMVCLETALPAKFAATIREAIGAEPPRPAAYEGIESHAQRYTLMPADLGMLKRLIAERAA